MAGTVANPSDIRGASGPAGRRLGWAAAVFRSRTSALVYPADHAGVMAQAASASSPADVVSCRSAPLPRPPEPRVAITDGKPANRHKRWEDAGPAAPEDHGRLPYGSEEPARMTRLSQAGAGTPSRTMTGKTRLVFCSYSAAPSEIRP
jgi:hypothetical protein